ncbi:MAG: FAD:protein transferase [Actinomycetota bacterium]|nr:FAD:protein transferase [Actinomycetota bacterium]
MPGHAQVLAGPVRGALPRSVWVEQVMGMPVSVHLRGEIAGPTVERAVAGFFDELRAVETELSPWRADSALNRLRRGELSLRNAGDRLRRIVQVCELARERTEGWFDAFCSPDAAFCSPDAALETGTGRGTASGSAPQEVPDRLDPTGDARFDPTGLVKGWAVELAAVRLETLPGVDHCVVAGGDVTVGCSLTDSPGWVIGVEDPTDRSHVPVTVSLRHGGIATSGTAARGPHILRPDTGAAAEDLLAVTVIGPCLTWADIHATAAFAQGPACVARLRALPDHAALVVDRAGTLTQVRGGTVQAGDRTEAGRSSKDTNTDPSDRCQQVPRKREETSGRGREHSRGTIARRR